MNIKLFILIFEKLMKLVLRGDITDVNKVRYLYIFLLKWKENDIGVKCKIK